VTLRGLRDSFRGVRDVRLFLRTARRLLVARRAMGRGPVPELLARFTPPLAAARDPGPPERFARYVDWWFRAPCFPVRYNCWARALVLFELCRLEGIPDVVLLVGIRMGEGTLDGHAWLSRDGQPFLEPPDRPDLSELTVLICHPGSDDEGDGA
jgi:hypothetical protein